MGCGCCKPEIPSDLDQTELLPSGRNIPFPRPKSKQFKFVIADLQYMGVEQAVDYARRVLLYYATKGARIHPQVDTVVVVVGKGTNDAYNTSEFIPAVEKLAKERLIKKNYRFLIDPKDDGHRLFKIKNRRSDGSWDIDP